MGDQAGETSKSVVLTGYGGYDNLKIQEWPLGTVGPNDVQISVEMCGVNFADLYTRQGLMRDRQPPFVLGMECVGIVSKKGDKVYHFKCCAGLFRASVIVPAANCFQLPDEMSWEDGAALAANYLTAFFCVLDIGNLQQAATDNGVTHAMNYDSYVGELRNMCPRGVDIIIDSLAGSNFTISQSLLSPLGRVILIGAKSVITGNQKLGLWSMVRMWWKTKTINAFDLIMENRVVAGLHLQHLMERSPERIKEAMDQLFDLHMSGKIKPKIDSVWNMEQSPEVNKKQKLNFITMVMWEPSKTNIFKMLLLLLLLLKTLSASNIYLSFKLFSKLPYTIKNLDRRLFKSKVYNWLLENPFYCIQEYLDMNIVFEFIGNGWYPQEMASAWTLHNGEVAAQHQRSLRPKL
ncbi:hypothetical protein C0J52_09953 [Blattella germanica]|nr:hypothetical protein C0J52_09953 [Blattella germanica]